MLYIDGSADRSSEPGSLAAELVATGGYVLLFEGPAGVILKDRSAAVLAHEPTRRMQD